MTEDEIVKAVDRPGLSTGAYGAIREAIQKQRGEAKEIIRGLYSLLGDSVAYLPADLFLADEPQLDISVETVRESERYFRNNEGINVEDLK